MTPNDILLVKNTTALWRRISGSTTVWRAARHSGHFHDKKPTATDVATVDWFVLKGALVVPPGADSGGGYGTQRIRDNVIQEIDYAIDVRASYNLELSDLRVLKNFLELISDKQQSVDSDIDTGLS